MPRRAALGGPHRVAPRAARAAAVLALALLSPLAAAAPAAAHDDLVGSTPREAQRLDGLPPEVELEFDQPALPGYSAVAVTGPDGTDLAAGAVVEDDVFVRMPVEAATVPGEHVMAYRVVASDGHPVSGEITFTVTGAPVEDTGAPAAAPGASTGAGATTASPGGPGPGTPTVASARPPTAAAGAVAGAVAAADGGPGVGLLAAVGSGAVLAAAAAALWWLRRRRGRAPGHGG